jgi:hypothetical protein
MLKFICTQKSVSKKDGVPKPQLGTKKVEYPSRSWKLKKWNTFAVVRTEKSKLE